MPAATPTEYPFDPTNYQATGFKLSDIERWGIAELPPLVMRSLALHAYAREAYPERGSRPVELVGRLRQARQYARRTLRTMSDEQRAIYDDRTQLRQLGRPREDWPKVPTTRIRPGRSTKAERAAILPTSRPRATWRDQALADLTVLQELGHAIPASRAPTQLYRTGADVIKAVPIERRRHLHTSCAGCERCVP